LSHKLEVGEQRSLASHYTLTTDENEIVYLVAGPSLGLDN